ncbi:993_t:CDS:10 [Paraglomus occultum]|uniref:Ubiquitin carboxyl-terminal hydrolase n=1 Tax=Paraglomus occultum TaxID=144539 RepID=A0A9N9BNN9_9GLOM|nr:993_t:CDS:10 [Paraglomus occultum]
MPDNLIQKEKTFQFLFGNFSREELETISSGVSDLNDISVNFRLTKKGAKLPVDDGTQHVLENVLEEETSAPQTSSNQIHEYTSDQVMTNGIESKVHHGVNGQAKSPTVEDETEQNTEELPPQKAEANLNKPQRSWAGLFAKPDGVTSQAITGVTQPQKHTLQNKQLKHTPAPPIKPKANGLKDVVTGFEASMRADLITPRGLVNNGNMCFMNAILQPLAHCPPLYNLLTKISKEVAHSFKSKTPLVDSMVMFLKEYEQSNVNGNAEQEYGNPFVPEYVYDAVRSLNRFDSMKGRQEDAEEFLGFLLDGMHEELVAALSNNESDVKENAVDGNAWLEVGPKNRTNITRATDAKESPVSRIFGGKMRSVLKCPGSKDSVTLQPFQSLQLDIQPDAVKTVEDALRNLTEPEYIDDYVSPQKGLVRASKCWFIEILPPVLILHLKRFVYDKTGGTQKLQKVVQYSDKLIIHPELISASQRTPKLIEYKLFGVVYHHGSSATGGHYTCDVLRQNDQWLRIDDTVIKPATTEDVVVTESPSKPPDRMAYLLFYMRT